MTASLTAQEIERLAECHDIPTPEEMRAVCRMALESLRVPQGEAVDRMTEAYGTGQEVGYSDALDDAVKAVENLACPDLKPPFRCAPGYDYYGKAIKAIRSLKRAPVSPTASQAPEQPQPVNCRDAGPGYGRCVECANGNYERCLYLRRAAPQERNAVVEQCAKVCDELGKDYRPGPDAPLSTASHHTCLEAAKRIRALRDIP